MVEVRSCGVLVWRPEPTKSFLLMQHTTRWDIPKGHVDPGETEVECALRELWEETGIKEDHLELDPDFCFREQYWVKKNRYGDKPKLKELVVFLGKLIEPVPIVVTEHIGHLWTAWKPPHRIQPRTIDPLLAQVNAHWEEKPENNQ